MSHRGLHLLAALVLLLLQKAQSWFDVVSEVLRPCALDAGPNIKGPLRMQDYTRRVFLRSGADSGEGEERKKVRKEVRKDFSDT